MKHSLLETAIGAVVLGAALIFLIFSYSTAHQGDASVMSGSYRLQAYFDNIGGLKIGDAVVISGVRVGAIDGIELDPKLYRADVSFNVADDVKLAIDTGARITSESLLGGKFLEILPGGADDNLKQGDRIMTTQSASNLEDLLGRFIFSAGDKKETSPPQPDEDLLKSP
jgi:phospholipid/cholesterol/gamma-HCH transport system substrate-binding protein